MKILDSKYLTEAFINKAVQTEKHELSAWALIEEDSVLVEGEQQTLILGNMYTEKLMGNLYVKIDSTHRNDIVNPGSLSGGEPTMTAEMRVERQKLWAEQFPLVTVEEIAKLRGYEGMTPEQYREAKREELEKLSKPGSFGFTLNIKGQDLEFNLDNEDRVDLLGQMAMGVTEFEVHDVQRLNSEPYSAEELGAIMVQLATVTKMHKYPIDAKIKALYGLPKGFTKEDVDKVVL